MPMITPTLPIASRLRLMFGVLLLAVVAAAASGVYGVLSKTQAALDAVVSERTTPLGQLDVIANAHSRSQLAIAQALLDPRPQRTAVYLSEVDANVALLAATWNAYMAGQRTAEQAQVAQAFAVHHERFLREGVMAAAAALQAGKVKRARTVALESMRPLYQPVQQSLQQLTELHVNGTHQAHAAAVASTTGVRNQALGAIGAGAVLALLVGGVLMASIQRRVIQIAEAKAEVTPQTVVATETSAGWEGVERRGPNRAKNVTRPSFRASKGKEDTAAQPATTASDMESAPPAKTGTRDS